MLEYDLFVQYVFILFGIITKQFTISVTLKTAFSMASLWEYGSSLSCSEDLVDG